MTLTKFVLLLVVTGSLPQQITMPRPKPFALLLQPFTPALYIQ
jgi:hypothetical protein